MNLYGFFRKYSIKIEIKKEGTVLGTLAAEMFYQECIKMKEKLA